MPFKEKEITCLSGVLFLLIFIFPASVSSNIDCNGKAFHCVNATHFKICVDLGGGVSSTVDDFIVSCPPPTVCKNTNHFECEFPTPTTAAPIKSSEATNEIKTSVTQVWEKIPVTTLSPKLSSERELSAIHMNTVSTTTTPTIDESTFITSKIHESSTITVLDEPLTTSPGTNGNTYLVSDITQGSTSIPKQVYDATSLLPSANIDTSFTSIKNEVLSSMITTTEASVTDTLSTPIIDRTTITTDPSYLLTTANIDTFTLEQVPTSIQSGSVKEEKAISAYDGSSSSIIENIEISTLKPVVSDGLSVIEANFSSTLTVDENFTTANDRSLLTTTVSVDTSTLSEFHDNLSVVDSSLSFPSIIVESSTAVNGETLTTVPTFESVFINSAYNESSPIEESNSTSSSTIINESSTSAYDINSLSTTITVRISGMEFATNDSTSVKSDISPSLMSKDGSIFVNNESLSLTTETVDNSSLQTVVNETSPVTDNVSLLNINNSFASTDDGSLSSIATTVDTSVTLNPLFTDEILTVTNEFFTSINNASKSIPTEPTAQISSVKLDNIESAVYVFEKEESSSPNFVANNISDLYLTSTTIDSYTVQPMIERSISMSLPNNENSSHLSTRIDGESTITVTTESNTPNTVIGDTVFLAPVTDRTVESNSSMLLSSIQINNENISSLFTNTESNFYLDVNKESTLNENNFSKSTAVENKSNNKKHYSPMGNIFYSQLTTETSNSTVTEIPLVGHTEEKENITTEVYVSTIEPKTLDTITPTEITNLQLQSTMILSNYSTENFEQQGFYTTIPFVLESTSVNSLEHVTMNETNHQIVTSTTTIEPLSVTSAIDNPMQSSEIKTTTSEYPATSSSQTEAIYDNLNGVKQLETDIALVSIDEVNSTKNPLEDFILDKIPLSPSKSNGSSFTDVVLNKTKSTIEEKAVISHAIDFIFTSTSNPLESSNGDRTTKTPSMSSYLISNNISFDAKQEHVILDENMQNEGTTTTSFRNEISVTDNPGDNSTNILHLDKTTKSTNLDVQTSQGISNRSLDNTYILSTISTDTDADFSFNVSNNASAQQNESTPIFNSQITLLNAVDKEINDSVVGNSINNFIVSQNVNESFASENKIAGTAHVGINNTFNLEKVTNDPSNNSGNTEETAGSLQLTVFQSADSYTVQNNGDNLLSVNITKEKTATDDSRLRNRSDLIGQNVKDSIVYSEPRTSNNLDPALEQADSSATSKANSLHLVSTITSLATGGTNLSQNTLANTNTIIQQSINSSTSYVIENKGTGQFVENSSHNVSENRSIISDQNTKRISSNSSGNAEVSVGYGYEVSLPNKIHYTNISEEQNAERNANISSKSLGNSTTTTGQTTDETSLIVRQRNTDVLFNVTINKGKGVEDDIGGNFTASTVPAKSFGDSLDILQIISTEQNTSNIPTNALESAFTAERNSSSSSSNVLINPVTVGGQSVTITSYNESTLVQSVNASFPSKSSKPITIIEPTVENLSNNLGSTNVETNINEQNIALKNAIEFVEQSIGEYITNVSETTDTVSKLNSDISSSRTETGITETEFRNPIIETSTFTASKNIIQTFNQNGRSSSDVTETTADSRGQHLDLLLINALKSTPSSGIHISSSTESSIIIIQQNGDMFPKISAVTEGKLNVPVSTNTSTFGTQHSQNNRSSSTQKNADDISVSSGVTVGKNVDQNIKDYILNVSGTTDVFSKLDDVLSTTITDVTKTASKSPVVKTSSFTALKSTFQPSHITDTTTTVEQSEGILPNGSRDSIISVRPNGANSLSNVLVKEPNVVNSTLNIGQASKGIDMQQNIGASFNTLENTNVKQQHAHISSSIASEKTINIGTTVDQHLKNINPIADPNINNSSFNILVDIGMVKQVGGLSSSNSENTGSPTQQVQSSATLKSTDVIVDQIVDTSRTLMNNTRVADQNRDSSINIIKSTAFMNQLANTSRSINANIEQTETSSLQENTTSEKLEHNAKKSIVDEPRNTVVTVVQNIGNYSSNLTVTINKTQNSNGSLFNVSKNGTTFYKENIKNKNISQESSGREAVINGRETNGTESSKSGNVRIFTRTKTNALDNIKDVTTNRSTGEALLNTSSTNNHNDHFNCRHRRRGRYADNNDCRRFYVCIGRNQPIIGQCPLSAVFSDIKKQCIKNLSHCVRNSEFQCASEGRFSDLFKENTYFICLNNGLDFIRFKFQCQNGYHLNKDTVKCIQKIEIVKLPTSSENHSKKDRDKKGPAQNDYGESRTDSEEDENSKDSREIKRVKKHRAERSDSKENRFECEEEGKFQDPQDKRCRRYFVCSKNKRSQYRRRKKQCDSDEVFDKDKKKCVDADTFECE